jgi:lipopolysaccharide export LptBFGC system permease protein LptF
MQYRPPSQRRNFRPSSGAVVFFCILGLIVAFIAFVIYENGQPQPQSAQTAVKAPQKPAALDMSYQERNTLREKDSRALWYAGGDFYRANFKNSVSVYPQAYANGMLTGADGAKPQKVTFAYYKAINIVQGVQAGVIKDEIRFVSNASCGPTSGATIADTTAFSYVVQYSQEDQKGSFTPACLKL